MARLRAASLTLAEPDDVEDVADHLLGVVGGDVRPRHDVAEPHVRADHVLVGVVRQHALL
jgi:hypothetical protein